MQNLKFVLYLFKLVRTKISWKQIFLFTLLYFFRVQFNQAQQQIDNSWHKQKQQRQGSQTPETQKGMPQSPAQLHKVPVCFF